MEPKRIPVALIAALVLAAPAAPAQRSAPAAVPVPVETVAPTPAGSLRASTATDGTTGQLPDIEFVADVHMDSVRFASDPHAHVEIAAGANGVTRHDVDRGSLPDPVRAGTTYRNVDVHTTISATLRDPSAPAAATSPNPPTEDSP